MKLFLTLSILILLTFTNFSFAQTQVNPGDVSGIWTLAGSPYLINGEINIPNDSTLVIEPGVIVEFQWHYQFNIHGRLLAIGSVTDTIVFTINDTTGLSNPDIPDGGWFGLRFENTSFNNDSSKIMYCKLQYGKALGSWPDNNGGAIWVLYFDKLIISNCLISNNIACGGDWPSGGGIALHGSSSIIKNNIIANNSAMNGGGIVCYDAFNPQIVNNLIVNNSATSGGGIVCNENSNPTITNTTIQNNNATDGGGGIICWYNSSPILDNVTISNNSAIWAGGIGAVNCNLQIDNCTFIYNEALVASGGAINCQYDKNLTYQLNIKNTVFTSNSASGAAGGLNARADDSASVNIIVDECTFENNEANRVGGMGFVGTGTINFAITNSMFINNEVLNHTGVGIFSASGNGMVSNCLFAFNSAGTNSGGVSVLSEVDFMNCTFANNSAVYGAGVTIAGGTATTTNCIFWGNIKNQIALDSRNNIGGTLTANYCDIQDGVDSVNVIDPLSTCNWGSGNIDSDPFFADAGNGDYHLQNASLCIGAGIDSIEIGGIWHYCPVTDIEGNPRPNPAGSVPDFGAYENSLGNPLSIEFEKVLLPKIFKLYQNYPNPFNPITKIKYDLPKPESVKIEVFNLLGQKIETLVDKHMPAGTHEVEFTANDLPSGVYFYRITAGEPSAGSGKGFQQVKKIILLK
ncbi:right-handed parallel beta-helix repeat-containing protein [Calditrichota bacterium]